MGGRSGYARRRKAGRSQEKTAEPGQPLPELPVYGGALMKTWPRGRGRQPAGRQVLTRKTRNRISNGCHDSNSNSIIVHWDC